MKILRIVFKYIFVFFLFLYFVFLFVLPTIVNSDFFLSKVNQKISEFNEAGVTVSSINLKTNFDVTSELCFRIEVKLPELKSTLIVGENGCLFFKRGKIYAENLSVKLSESQLLLSGLIFDINKESDLSIKGDNLPVKDVYASLLHFQKYRNKGQKVFIENFKDFIGLIDVDLIYKNNGLYGACKTQNLGAHSVLFNVPILFSNAVFNFEDRLVWAEAEGTLGEEEVFTSFILTNMATPQQEVKGKVLALLSDRLAEKYIPNTTIKEKIIASVDYSVKNKKINVNYSLNLPMGSDLGYKNAHLGLDDFSRRLFVQTEKFANKLEIKNYDYSLVDENEITNILLGRGLLLKENGHFYLHNISCKTNGYAPVSVTGSFGEYVDGGFFEGDLVFNARTNKILGDFVLIDSNYKDFYLEKAVVSADENTMKVTANGTYDDYPFNWYISAKNDFNNKIDIYNMDLYLQKFIVRKGDYKVKSKRKNTSKLSKKIDIDIANWSIRLDEISHNRILVEDISLSGSLKNNVFNFLMSDVKFANGLLNAYGWYNFSNHSSDIVFSAQNIDSNIVADTAFGLSNQISGLASANLHAKTTNKLENISGNASFSIKQGYLPKLGSTEFIISKSKKFKKPLRIKLSDIINVNISKAEALASDINGSFSLSDFDMQDINLTSQQKYLSLYIEGDYNVEKQDANLQLFGKYNKIAPKGVKVLFIPLDWILKFAFRPEESKAFYQQKLDKIPSINANKDEEQNFRVKFDGNINTNNINVELKAIK